MARSPDEPEPIVTLRDGRAVIVRELTPGDEAEVARLVGASADARLSFYERSAQQRGAEASGETPSAAFVALISADQRIVGYATYLAVDEQDGELAGVVDPAFAGIGLGTLLVRRAAEHARLTGLETLHVDLHPGSEDTAAMIRDSGFPSHWDLAYPVARVELLLGRTRPGWSTPEYPPAEE
ncbi:MAG: GNAT family N-acetyltransferase [Solirubrobacteraceae bacterium]